MRRIFSAGIFLLFLWLTACGQEFPHSTPAPVPTPASDIAPEPVASHFYPGSAIRFETLNVEEGLSQSVVHAIAQDHQGFIWFGTQDGLNRYDGHNFKVYKPEPGNPSSLSDGWVTALLVDTDGFLWIGTRQGGLNRYDPRTGIFTRYINNPTDSSSLSDNQVIVLYQSREGILWAGTANGLNRYEPSSASFTRYMNNPLNPASLSQNVITSIFQDSRNGLWIGTRAGLNLFRPAVNIFQIYRTEAKNPASISSDSISSISEDAGGRLWIGTEKGLNRFDPITQTFTRYLNQPENPHSLGYNKVNVLLVDRGGSLWVGTDDGLDRFDEENARFIHYRYDPLIRDSLSNNVILSIYEDRGGILWFGAWGGGVNKYDHRQDKFTYYRYEPRKPNNLPEGSVWAIYPEKTGQAWVGFFGSGLALFDPATGQVLANYRQDDKKPDSLGSTIVYSILRDSQGILWVGTADGLDQFDEQAGSFRHYRFDKNDPESISANQIFKIHEDRYGRLWVGTRRGLDRYNRATHEFTHYFLSDENDNASPISVSDIQNDRDGESLWIATLGMGLYHLEFRTGEVKHFTNNPQDSNSLPNDLVLSIYPDQEGLLWLATGGSGLSKFNPQTGRFTTYTESAGLSNNFVYCIIPDEQGFLWISTNYGVSKFNPRAESFETFTRNDGLQSNEFNQGACARGPDQAIYFGGGAGLNRFFPANVRASTYQPPVALTSITYDGKPLELNGTVETIQEIVLEWPKASFEFEFAALSFAEPRKNRYAYMLENFDTGWNYINFKRDGRYTNLPGGEYILRLKAANSEGVWNETGTAIKVTVIPPFWQTWWFYSLMGLLVIGMLWGGYQMRVRSILTRKLELERQVSERTREIERLFEQTKELAVIEERNRLARELHDSAKQKAFAALAQLGTANGLIQHDVRAAKSHINEAENLVYDVIQELTFLIQEMYPLALKEKGLVTSLREYVFEWETRTDIPVSLQAENEIRLPLEMEQAIYRIAQESLANVARHSRASYTEISVIYSHNSVTLNIRDNGQGFDPSHKPLGIGLRSMQERAESIGGRLAIKSMPGTGTTVSATIPLNGSSKS